LAKAEDQNFELGGKEGSANAIVTGGEFKLEVEVGQRTDYSKTEKKNFILSIGGCEVKIGAFDSLGGIQYDFGKDGDLDAVLYGLDSVVVTNSGGIVFKGKGASKYTAEVCIVDFGNEKNGNYYVPVKLSGDVPKAFKLYSTTIKMGDRSGESNPPEKFAGAGSKIALIVGLCVGGLFILLASSGGIGLFVYRWRKNKILQQQCEKKQVESGKNVEAATPTDNKTPAPKAQDPKTTESKTPSKTVEADKKDAKSKEPRKKVTKSKEGSKEKKGASKEKPKDIPKDKEKEAPKEKQVSPKEKPAEDKEQSGRTKKKTEEDKKKPAEDKEQSGRAKKKTEENEKKPAEDKEQSGRAKKKTEKFEKKSAGKTAEIPADKSDTPPKKPEEEPEEDQENKDRPWSKLTPEEIRILYSGLVTGSTDSTKENKL